MAIHPGSLILVSKIPQSNAGVAKHPFCVVEIYDTYFVALPISSNMSKATYPYNVALSQWEDSGLRKPSIVKCDFPLKCSYSDLITVFGRLSLSDAAEVINRYDKYVRSGGELFESYMKMNLTAHNLYQQIIYKRNRLKNILSEVEFEERVISSDEYERLCELYESSELLLKYLDGTPLHVKVELPSEYKSIFIDLLNSVNKYEEE